MKTRLTALLPTLLLAVPFFSVFADDMEDWQDPGVYEINRLKMAATFVTDQQQTLSLDGIWMFSFKENVDDRLTGFESLSYDDSAWDTMPVPGMWELNGFGDPLYLNVGYAWRGHYENNPPYVPTEHNHVGQYRRSFTVPDSWMGKQICLCVGSATSNLRVWVNGKEVGYSEDSKLEARFDISKFVHAGENLIAFEIFRWCDGTYLEDQDFWRFSGIARGVYIYTREQKRIEDVHVSANMNGELLVYAEVSPGVSSVSFEVLTGEGSPVLDFDGIVSKEKTSDGAVMVSGEAELSNPALWSAEEPNLYTLRVIASDKKGLCESADIEFGFRSVEIKDTQLLVNGKPVLIKGTDRHELNPYKGYVLSEQDMIEDIRIMKQLNINAVRTCHYPDDPLWLSLCDKYGLYVVDEGNIESHGMGYGEKTLAVRDDYLAAHLIRDQRMVMRDINHPSVVIWSLGNEAGDGPNFEACYEWIKSFDPTRPVMYERAVLKDHTDIYCPMYLPPQGCVKYLENDPPKPLIQCEYAHAMGNSMGNFKEYWDLVRKYPSYQGGFIWDFQDQAIRWPSALTRTVSTDGAAATDYVFAFGGDFNDYDPSDGSFNCNGIIAADRSLHPHAYEVRYQYRDIHSYMEGTANVGVTPYAVSSQEGICLLASDTEWVVNVYNEKFFTDLSNYRLLWDVEIDGIKVLSGVVDELNVSPHETTPVPLGISFSDLPCYEGRDVFLNLSYTLKASDGLLEAGTELSYDQLAIATAPIKAFQAGSAATVSPLSGYEDGSLVYYSGEFAYGKGHNSSWEAVFSKTVGALVGYRINGKEQLSSPLMPNFYRAPTENDLGARLDQKCSMWAYPEFLVASFDVDEGEVPTITVEYKPIGGVAAVVMGYEIFPDGSIVVTESMKDAGGLSGAPDMFRFGMTLGMPGSASVVDFYGRGPWENYSDRSSSAVVGHYVQSVNDQYHYGYVRTQESGTKTGLRWIRVTDDNGTGLEVSSDVLFSASALPFSVHDLDVSLTEERPRPNPTNTQSGVARHSLELKGLAHEDDRSAGNTYLSFDLVQMGVGGINSWGRLPLESYLVHPVERSFSFVIRPLNN